MRNPALAAALFLVACGGTATRVQAPTPAAPPADAGEAQEESQAPAPPPNVEASALPYSILKARGGQEVDREEFYRTLLASRAVCVGESHTDAHHHWAQLEVIDKLTADGRGGQYGTGMEMFQRPVQGVLDDFATGKIAEEDMLSRSDWKRRWSYDWNYYAPQVRLTIERGGKVLALNISKELKDKWKKRGTEGMTADEAAKVPELDLEDKEHYNWFRDLMESFDEGEGHGKKDASKEDSAHAWMGAALALLGDQDLPPGHPTLPPGHPTPKGNKPAKGHGKGKMPKGHGKGHKMPKGHGKGHKLPPGHPTTPKGHSMPKGHGKGKAMPNDAVHNPNHPDNQSAAAAHEPAPEEKSVVDQIYPVQVLWDETMADTAARWLQADPERRIVILAGNGHCHDSAIVRRMKRRGIESVVSVRPVIDSGSGEVADVLASPRNDYLFVMKKAADAEAPAAE